MTEPTEPGDLARLQSMATALLRHAVLLQLEITALSHRAAPASVAADPTMNATGRCIRFDPATDRLSDPAERLKAYQEILPGVQVGFEVRQPVVAHGRWMARDGEPTAGYRVRIDEPAATGWLTIEFLIDPVAAAETGLVALNLTAEAAPTLEVPGLLRLYLTDGTAKELPLVTTIFGGETSSLVDATRIPDEVRAAIDPARPLRYILYLPRMPLDLVIVEAVTYPAAKLIAARPTSPRSSPP